MGIKKYKPTSPSRRFITGSDFSEITKRTPEKSLVQKLKKKSGRNSYGRITVRRRGGGHKRMYRIIDFKRDKDGVPATVAAIEYDPNRSVRIALLHYLDGEKRYILCPKGLQVGQQVLSGPKAEPKTGNCLMLADIPMGLPVHNIELRRGCGGKMVRSAGTVAQVSAKEGKWAHITLPSGEVRKIDIQCRGTIGQLGNIEHGMIKQGKAGRNRWRGRRPKVRGTAQNPVSHPMGGGEGRSAGGRHPCSPTGVPSKGGKTRRRSNPTNKFIVRRRKAKGRG